MLPTRNHQEIRAWAERHKAIPAEISGTENGTPALLDFLLAYGLPRSRTLNIISWEDFFARFDILELSMAWDDGGQFTLVRVAPESPRRLTH